MKPKTFGPIQNRPKWSIYPDPAPFYLRLKIGRNFGTVCFAGGRSQKNNPTHPIVEEI